jgi:uncharacterized protein
VLKKLIAIAVLFVLSLSVTTVAYAEMMIPNKTGDIYVQDFADVLSPTEEQELIQIGKEVDNTTTAQIAVMTVKTMDGYEIEEYANAAFKKYAIGDKEKNNGVLLILAVDDKQVRIEVGYGLEGALTDVRTGQILDQYAIPLLKEGKFNQAVTDTYETIRYHVAKEYQLEDVKPAEKEPMNPILLILIIVGIVILVILDFAFFGGFITYLVINILSTFRGGGGSSSGGGGDSGGGGSSRSF